jgi:phospholipid-binding lipoprotein MlaA
LGPRTVRDTAGLVLDVATDPVVYIDNVPTRNTLASLRVVNDRANLLPAEKVIEEAALDKYSYIRDAYLQRRRSLVYDGNPPREAEDAP